jgi:Domain of unknown function (DUF4136)
MNRAALILLLIIVGAVSVAAQKVRVGADPAVDLSRYKTYASSQGMAGPNALVNAQIVAAVDRELAAKGLHKVETEPELTLAAWVWTESDMHVTNPSWAPVLNSISTGVAVGAQSWAVTKGTLVIDISDSKTKNGVWRGTATETLNHNPSGNKAKDAKNAEKPIKKAVDKMFKKFPRP